MKILFAAAEASPFIKTGGLGDVMGSLPKVLAQKNIDVRVVLPFYSAVKEQFENTAEYLGNITVNNSWRKSYLGVFKMKYEGVIYYFLDNEQYFKRSSIYGNYDDGEIFAFFSRAVLDVLAFIDFIPDIINANDWHTAMIPVYLNAYYKHREKYKNIKTVLSIHNIEFQGKFDPYILGQLFGLDFSYKPLMTYDGDINVLKAGIESADLVSTVSKSYSEEILRPEYSFGLHHILNARRYKIRGIVNGIDTEVFNPETDKNIKTKYNALSVRNKRYNKLYLQKSMGLNEDSKIPLIGMVTRLTSQKGIELVKAVRNELSSLPVQIIVLGTGDREYEDLMHEWENQSYENVRGVVKFSVKLASQVYAGADFLLMPSVYEPCGLSQLIAMRYGCIPIVHTVGGLKDTVTPYNPETKTGNGITFESSNPYDMLDAVMRGIEILNNTADRVKIRKNAMSTDVSWGNSAEEYIKMYKELIN